MFDFQTFLVFESQTPNILYFRTSPRCATKCFYSKPNAVGKRFRITIQLVSALRRFRIFWYFAKKQHILYFRTLGNFIHETLIYKHGSLDLLKFNKIF